MITLTTQFAHVAAVDPADFMRAVLARIREKSSDGSEEAREKDEISRAYWANDNNLNKNERN